LLKNKLPAKAIEYFKNPNVQNSEYKLMRGLFTNDELQVMGWDHATMHPFSPASGKDGDEWLHDNAWMHDLVKVSYLESCYYMRNQLLPDSDVFSMAHGLELRVPFVDDKLYTAVLPYLDDAYDKNFPKKMLVDAVGDIPLELINRPKMGFTFPFADWIMNGQLKNKMNNSIQNLNSKLDLSPFIPEMNSGQTFDLDKLHWSRLWALYILSKEH
jgi:asparagine synthase (glutamine-hydrolysing)